MTITAPPPRTRAPGQPRTVQPRAGQSRTGQPRAPQRSGLTEAGGQPRTVPAAERTRSRSAASQRAYARRAQRQAGHPDADGLMAARRTPFVLLVMALLAVGLIVSLWLSTAAAADSYRLEQARVQARELSERSELLRQEVASLQTAPELARRARELGLVPTNEPARLVVQPDGTVLVVGEPEPVVAPPPPAPPALAPEQQAPAGEQPAPNPSTDPGTQNPAGQDPASPDPAVQAAGPDPAGQPAGTDPAAAASRNSAAGSDPAAQNPGAQDPGAQNPGAQNPPPGGG